MTPEQRAARNEATREAVERLLAVHETPGPTPNTAALYLNLDPETVDPNFAYAYYAYADLEET